MLIQRKALRALATAALAAVAGVAAGQEGEWTYSGSLHYASGDYTLSETTTSLLLFSGLSYQRGRATAGGRYSILAAVSGTTETLAGVDGPVQAGLTLSRLVDTGRNFSLTVSAGLTDSAPDYAITGGWRVGL